MQRIHFLQQWLGLSESAMKEALHDVPLYCEFSHLDADIISLPDEPTIQRIHHLLQQNNLSAQQEVRPFFYQEHALTEGRERFWLGSHWDVFELSGAQPCKADGRKFDCIAPCSCG